MADPKMAESSETSCRPSALVVETTSNTNCEVLTYDQINWETFRPNRAGIIIYTSIEERCHFILGIDREHREIDSFAGGASYRKHDINAAYAACREFNEETLGVFGTIDPGIIQPNTPVIVNIDNVILFVNLAILSLEHFNQFRELFKQKVTLESEMADLIIIRGDQFIEAIINNSPCEDYNFYSKLRNLLLSDLSFVAKL